MNEDKIKNSFQNIKKDVGEVKSNVTEILNELRALNYLKSSKLVTPSKEVGSEKIFTSKVSVTEGMRESVNEVFDSGIFTSGEKVREFEKKFSNIAV